MEKKLFRYYQTDEKGAWFPIIDSDGVEAKAVALGAKRLSALALTELVDSDTTDKSSLAYKGPLYFDIDHKHDLQAAIDACKRLVDNLLSRSVNADDINVYCSGAKGMHVLVAQKAFSNGRVQKRLPAIYKEMALKLFVSGMDFAPYGGSRGNLFRIAGIQRDDGKYRTAISIDELRKLTVGQYESLCTSPRDWRHPPFVGELSTSMEMLYETAKQAASKKLAPVIAVGNATLEKIKADAPNCIVDMVEYKKIATDKPFNAVAMQVAIWAARSGAEESVYMPVMERLSENASSNSLPSPRQRLEHLEGQVSYMAASKSYEFSCGGMRSVLAVRPCEGCPIECSNSSTAGAEDFMGVVRKSDGYYLLGKNDDIRLTTFTLDPSAVVIDYPQDGSAPRRLGTQMTVDTAAGPAGEIIFREAGWQSGSAFKLEVSGLGNLATDATDGHIQRIKHLIYADVEQTVNEIRQVYTAGIHFDQRPDGVLATYVEPSFSVNSLGVEDGYRLQGEMLARPYFKSTEICAKGDPEADIAMSAMCRMNSLEDLSIIVGWVVASNLKEHFRTLYAQFPSLGVWGAAGSGKSKTLQVVLSLSGMDLAKDTPVNVSSITPFASLTYAASTMTIPRIMEEFNRSKMGKKKFDEVCEIVKSSWGCESHVRGAIGQRSGGSAGRTGAHATAFPVSGPLLTVSEQAIDIPAVMERQLQVFLSKSKRSGLRVEHDEANSRRGKLREIGKYLMLRALTTSLDTVKAGIVDAEQFTSKDLDDRPAYSHQVIHASLKWLEKCMRELELPKSEQAVADLLDAHMAMMSKEGADGLSTPTRTEIDGVIETMGAMALLSARLDEKHKHLVWGVHYTSTPDHIIIEPTLAHIMYKRYKTGFEHETPVIHSASQFVKLLEQEPYYDGVISLKSMSKFRHCVKISKAGMALKGLDPSLFCEEE